MPQNLWGRIVGRWALFYNSQSGHKLVVNARNTFSFQCSLTITVEGDGIDNDCDGFIDEEIRDQRDNDGDGYVDEDLSEVIHDLKFKYIFKALFIWTLIFYLSVNHQFLFLGILLIMIVMVNLMKKEEMERIMMVMEKWMKTWHW